MEENVSIETGGVGGAAHIQVWGRYGRTLWKMKRTGMFQLKQLKQMGGGGGLISSVWGEAELFTAAAKSGKIFLLEMQILIVAALVAGTLRSIDKCLL